MEITDVAITLASLASFFVLVLSWVALPHGAPAAPATELKSAAQAA